MSRLWRLALLLVVGVLGLSLAPSALATNYFVSNSGGSDSNNGTSTATPWKTLTKVNGFAFAASDQVEFKRGDSWTGGLTLSRSGTSGHRINYFNYGTGSRPDISGGISGVCIKTTGNFLTVDNLYVHNCGTTGTYIGVEVASHDVQVKNMQASNNVVGMKVDDNTDTNVQINNNTISNNNILNASDPYGYNGAEGVIAAGGAVVNNNTITGSDRLVSGTTYAGTGVLLVNATSPWVHHNTFQNNHVGVQFYGSGAGSTSAAVEYNSIETNLASTDAAPTGIDRLAPSTNVWISHNSIDELGTGAVGIHCTTCQGGDTVTSNAVSAGLYSLNANFISGSGYPSITGNALNGASHLTGSSFTLDTTNQTATIGWVGAPTNLAETSTSPTIDAATISNLTTDINGATVPDATGQSDTGAYEFTGGDPHCGPCTLTVTDSFTHNGTGSVQTNPSGITCGATCSASFNYDSTVYLNGFPGTNTNLTWSGACAGAQWLGCNTVMSQSRAITATFDDPVPGTPLPTANPPLAWSVNGYSGTDPWGAMTGEVLTLNPSSWNWTNSPTSFSVQWQRCSPTCTNISGATNNSYTVQAADVGTLFQENVCGINSSGQNCITTGGPPAATMANAGSDPSPRDLTVTNVGQTSITVTWSQDDDVQPAAGNLDLNSSGTPIATVKSGVGPSTYTYTGLACNTSYDLSVQAVDVGGNTSGWLFNNGVTTAACPAGPKITHVIWVTMENQAYGSIVGNTTDAPYINNTIIASNGLASNYYSTDHQGLSLPNYIGMTSGTSAGITDDNGPGSHPLSGPSIFSQLPGGQSRSLEESMPGTCNPGNSTPYAVRHNPMTYYTAVTAADCAANDIPYNNADLNNQLNGAFTFITPNLCSDGHDSCAPTNNTIKQQDNWLATNIPLLKASSEYTAGNTAIFVTWDEDVSPFSGHVPLLVISPVTPHATDATSFSHYSLLATTEQLLGVPTIGGAATATSMIGHFGF